VGSRPQTGHGTQKALLSRREPVKPDAEKVGIEATNYGRRGAWNNLQRDG
jgi:hypothetical protein